MNVEAEAVEALARLLREVEIVSVDEILREAQRGTFVFDIYAKLHLGDRPIELACEVRQNGQPRNMRDAALRLKRVIADTAPGTIPLLIAPYLSEQAQAVCREEGVAYLDFEGNARIVFDTVFIERRVEGRPEPERRALRSLFKPKSARVIRLLLKDPARAWRIGDLADAAQVSIGHASGVGAALKERDWAEQGPSGLQLTDPAALLGDWASEYARPKGTELRLYTHFHGAELERKLKEAMAASHDRAVLSSFSAADWLHPYARHGSTFLYADETGLAALQVALEMQSAAKGANVMIVVPEEDGVLADAVEAAPGLVCTSPVQTYLDLMAAGERGREAAGQLRTALLNWTL